MTEDDFKAQQFRVQNLWNPEELLKGPRLRRNVTKVNAAGEIVPDDRTRTRRAEEVEDNTPGRHEGSEIAVHPSEMPMGIARHRRTINDVEELLVRDWNDREEGDDAAGTIREKGKDRETVLNRPIMTSSEDGIGGESQSIGDTILRNTVSSAILSDLATHSPCSIASTASFPLQASLTSTQIPTIPAPQMPPNLHSSHPSNHPAGDTTLENTVSLTIPHHFNDLNSHSYSPFPPQKSENTKIW